MTVDAPSTHLPGCFRVGRSERGFAAGRFGDLSDLSRGSDVERDTRTTPPFARSDGPVAVGSASETDESGIPSKGHEFQVKLNDGA